eukprot:scaffold73918_cov18-Tisochrysis_lutea.AAC.1
MSVRPCVCVPLCLLHAGQYDFSHFTHMPPTSSILRTRPQGRAEYLVSQFTFGGEGVPSDLSGRRDLGEVLCRNGFFVHRQAACYIGHAMLIPVLNPMCIVG